MAQKAKAKKGRQHRPINDAEYRSLVASLVRSNEKQGARSKASMALRKALRRSQQWRKRKPFLGRDTLAAFKNAKVKEKITVAAVQQ